MRLGPIWPRRWGWQLIPAFLCRRSIPAERAGIRGGNQLAYVGNTPILLGGDFIVAVDGQPVTDPREVSAILEKHQAGDTVSVTFYRGRKQITLKLIAGEARESNP